jgi:hypothetical protein
VIRGSTDARRLLPAAEGQQIIVVGQRKSDQILLGIYLFMGSGRVAVVTGVLSVIRKVVYR